MQTFRELQAVYRSPVVVSHAQRVTRLYRKALRTLDSWAVDKQIWNAEAEKVRARFDANKGVGADSGAAQRLVREAEEEMATWTHPDMYTLPYMPGGSKFMRNPALPLASIFPNGVPPEYDIATKDVWNIQVHAGRKGYDTILVDPMVKRAE